MADFIPANIIQTPDFGGLAKQRIDRQRAEETAKNNYLDQFEEQKGLYLDGDREAVQGAWNNVQKAIDAVAENDSPESRRALKQVYADYSQVAGTAQVLANQHREQVAAYKSDPTKFALSGSDFFNWDKEFRTKKRNFNDMVSALDNPNVLPSAGSYALLNPYDQAKTLMADTSNVAATFYDKSGNLDEMGLRERVGDIAKRRIMASPEAVERAIIWGATTKNNPQSGFVGDGDGKINSLEELEMIKNLPEEERQKYFDAYVNSLVDDYVSLTPGRAAADKSGKKPLAVSSVSIQAAGGQNVDFITLPGTLETSYNIENEDGTKSSVTGDIVQIGASPDGELFVTIEREVSTDEIDAEGNTVTRMETEYRPATQMEVDKIMSKYGNTYDFSPLTSKGEAAPAQTAPAEEKPAATTEAPAETPAEAPADKPKDTLGLGLFDTPAATEEAPAEAPAETPAAEPTQPVVAVDPAIEEKADATMKRITGGISAKQLEEDKPYMLKEAAQLQKDIAATKQKIKDAEANGQDVTELNKALEDQKRVLKKVNELNRKISERRERRAFEESLPTLGEDQPAKEEAKKEAKESTTGEEYIVIDGKVYYKKDYAAVAGKKTGRGNYPDTFEEYADAYGVAIMNTKEEPVGTELDEVTITAERLEPPTQKEDNTVQGASVSPAVKKPEEKDVEVVDITGAGPSLIGSGKSNDEYVYKPRAGAIAPAEQWTKDSGVPAPSKNPSSKSAPSYYMTGAGEGVEWTPENVKKAMDRWNSDVPVAPETFIKVSNTFGIPVEVIIALAAQESELGVGDRQIRTKNFFNWGNSTKGDKLPPGPEQDKYNKYFKTWEDGLMAWADGFVRLYRPEDGDWSKLWQEAPTKKNKKGEWIGGSFVSQREVDGVASGSRYADNPVQEKKIKEIIEYSIPYQFDPKRYRKK